MEYARRKELLPPEDLVWARNSLLEILKLDSYEDQEVPDGEIDLPALLNALTEDALARGDISAGHARALLSVTDEALQKKLYAAILEHHLSVRETEAAADTCKRSGKLPEKLEPQGNPAAPRAARTPRPQVIKNLQNLLRQSCGTRATISGNEQQGRIQIPYASPEELARILGMLGLKDEDSQN